MSQRGLEQFGAYEKARVLCDLVVADMQNLKADNRCFRLIAQQVGSADSICANIEEVTEDSAAQSTFGFSISREVLLARRVGATSE